MLANFNYLKLLPSQAVQPLPYDVELVLGDKDADTRRLPVVDVRSLGDVLNDFDFEPASAGFKYIKHHSLFLDRCKREGKDVTDSNVVGDEDWTTDYGAEIRQILQNVLYVLRS